MNISSSFNAPLTSGVSHNSNAPIKNSVRSVEPVVVSDIEKEQSSNNPAKSRVVIDEQAIALFEQNQVEQNQASFSATAPSSKENSFFEGSSTSQSQLSVKNETAVANYQAVGNLAQRESVQKLFGVDLFA